MITIDKVVLLEARKKMGDKAASLIAADLELKNFDNVHLKSLCPFHSENTGSFIWYSEGAFYKCFGCNRKYDIVDHYEQFYKLSFLQAVKRLFEEQEIQYNFNEVGAKKKDYIYPIRENNSDRSTVEEYLGLRKISTETLDRFDVQQDANKNIVFHYYDTHDVLYTVHYRPARKLKKSDVYSYWAQKNADNRPLLYGMHLSNPTMPLVITEGQIDTLSVYEAGYTNVVSIPHGAVDRSWIEENFDFLEQFEKIIIWSDNDDPGITFRRDAISRLGSWRTLYVDLPTSIDGQSVKDANEVLYYFGKEKVLEFIENAQTAPIQNVVDLADVDDFDIESAPGLYTNIPEFDKLLYKFVFGTVVLVTGRPGCVDADTEYFNGTQWTRIADYNGEKVLQYNQDGSASLVTPSQYIKHPKDYLWHFKTKYGIDQCLSEDHNVVYITSKDNLYSKPFSEVKKGVDNGHNFLGKFITTFDYKNGSGIDYDENTIRLIIAAIADGSYYYQLGKNAKTYNKCRFHIKKQYKKDRLKYLLEKSGFEWYEKESANIDYTDFYVMLPERIKEFDKRWYACTPEQLEIICDEVWRWDGSLENNESKRFYTTIKKNADFIQFVFANCGYRARIETKDRRGRTREINGKIYTTKSIDYVVHATRKIFATIDNKDIEQRNNIFKKYKTVDGYEYCFSVPSSMLVLRRNGCIFITGNSGKSSLLNQLFVCESLNQDHGVFYFSGEMPKPILRSWIDLQLSGRKYITVKNEHVRAIKPEIRKQVKEWYKGKIWVYDNDDDNSIDSILNRAENVVRRFGAKIVILDNLTTIGLNATDMSIWIKQKELMIKLKSFAAKFNVLVVLVSHPKKTLSPSDRLTGQDIAGSSDLYNLCQYAFSMHRFTEKEKQGEKDGKGNYKKGKEPIEFDSEVELLKNRLTGRTGSFKSYFDSTSYRFYTDTNTLWKRYKWDTTDNSPLPKNDPNHHVPEFME